MAYNPSQWDTLPINDDNLYTLLHHATNPPLTLDPTRFPAPAVDNPTPPASEGSSPSPPSINEREQFAAQTARQTRSATGAFDDDSAKRKQDDITDSDDSSYEQPSKHQHRSGDRDGIGGGPRRSTGGTKKKGAADENRALKRKEQNRAAQRAFRERKERHVKELEDQVAALEARAANQDRENENLRDLLGRLQNENLLLKQSAFTFSFPAGANNPDASGATAASTKNPSVATANHRPSSPKLPSPSSSSNASTPENTNTTGDVPQSTLFARPNSSATGLNSNSSISSGSSPRSEATTSRFQSSPGAFGLGSALPDSNNVSGLDATFFGADLNLLDSGKANNVNGITTIAANPMFMSFGDPVLDPMAWASFGPGDYTSSPTIANPSSDLELYGIPTYGNNGAINVPNAAPNAGLGLTNYSFDLFGTAPTTGSGVTPSFLDLSGNHAGTQSTASSSTGGPTFTASSPSAVGTNSEVNSSAAGHKDDEHGTCPKTIEDVHRMQKTMSPSTFGPPVTVKSLSPGSTKSPSSPGSLPQRENNEKGQANAHARMAALCADLPRTTKKPNQIEIGRAWEKIRQHQGFEECDIDELCNELSAKARCDGSRPVLEEASFNNIVQSLATMRKGGIATA